MIKDLNNKDNNLNIIQNKNVNIIKRIKQLSTRIKFKAGRNFGVISSPRRKSYNKKIYRFIDFDRNINSKIVAVVRKIEYSSFSNNKLALICYPFGMLQYVILNDKIEIGNEIINFGLKIGDSNNIKNFKSGTIVSNLGLYKQSCGKLIRSAGTSAIIVRNSNNFSLIKLKSGELRLFNDNVMCVKGSISDSQYFLRDLKKASTTLKLLNKRPRNRALARNPVDHPMGGRTKGGLSKTPSGRASKWTSSINMSTMSKFRILTRRKSKFIKF